MSSRISFQVADFRFSFLFIQFVFIVNVIAVYIRTVFRNEADAGVAY